MGGERWGGGERDGKGEKSKRGTFNQPFFNVHARGSTMFLLIRMLKAMCVKRHIKSIDLSF